MKKFTSINFSPPFDAVKSSTSNLTKLDPLCPLPIPFVKNSLRVLCVKFP